MNNDRIEEEKETAEEKTDASELTLDIPGARAANLRQAVMLRLSYSYIDSWKCMAAVLIYDSEATVRKLLIFGLPIYGPIC